MEPILNEYTIEEAYELWRGDSKVPTFEGFLQDVRFALKNNPGAKGFGLHRVEMIGSPYCGEVTLYVYGDGCTFAEPCKHPHSMHGTISRMGNTIGVLPATEVPL